MADEKAPGTATPPPTLGEGCTSRYDLDALSEEDGTEFPGAAELWRELQDADAPAGAPPKKP
ncbi:hypothetical protein SAMN05216189_100488 [Pseudomonas delhiensis]|uniref:Uncharacterized protein n=1 Tax=Pseudomonas delhiensis TaxID=366289 RepID=A0A239E8X6_9PSED|nr:hypothetical protein [Pseudomonas delhiensis]SDI34178.1 hypothetical protein SAMN05216189_100488 [Pseudomonas delhiensis]SNS40372.1 hypothetical protein SAMN06295949_101283 [Pseudomonas delhiensis]